MVIIIVTGFEAATNADVLQATRLQTVPENGVLGIECQASDNIPANNYVASLELPDGTTPFTGMLVPGTATAGLTGILDSRLAFKATFPISQGGHCTLGFTETGDSEVFWRVTFKGR